MRKPKRPCPKCQSSVIVTRTITLSSTKKVQHIKCSSCGITGSVCQNDVITWDDADLQSKANKPD